MVILGVVFESLKIDKMEKKWVTRSLFLLTLLVLIWLYFFPVGDPDVSKLLNFSNDFIDELGKNPDINQQTAIANTFFAKLPWKNVVYIFFQVFVFFTCIMISWAYARLAIGENKKQSFKLSLKETVKYIPLQILLIFILFCLVMITSFLFLGNFLRLFYGILVVYVSIAFLFIPFFMSIHKKTLMQAGLISFQFLRANRFLILTSFMVLSSLLFLINNIFNLFSETRISKLSTMSIFFTSYFVLAFGRLLSVLFSGFVEEKQE